MRSASDRRFPPVTTLRTRVITRCHGPLFRMASIARGPRVEKDNSAVGEAYRDKGMFHRPLLIGDVIRVNGAREPDASQLGNWPTRGYRPIKASALPQGPALPCIIDLARARTLYALGLDPKKVRDAPFAGLLAREQATATLLVPWEAGPINRPRVNIDPLYVFSSGRCGSTLLHNILVAANINSVSEPEIASALISPVYAKYRVARPALRWATRIFARDLVSMLGAEEHGLVVKLRSQFCKAAPAMLKGSRERRTIFMTRRFEDWAGSVAKIFRVTPHYLVEEYRRSLLCYGYLRQHSKCHLLTYEDLVSRPVQAMKGLAFFLQREISADAIASAMRARSQEGTPFDQTTERQKARWEAMREETYSTWKSSGAAAQCAAILNG